MIARDGILYAEPGEIFGWYDWQPFTDRAVRTAPRGAVLVELGVFLGKSLRDLGRKAQEAGESLRVFGIDTFAGSPEFDGAVFMNGRPIGDNPAGATIGLAYENLQPVLDTVSLVVGDSATSAALFAPRSVWSVFIDADHSEEGVRRDIAAWLPKIAPGGWIGGHDYGDFPGVKAAVDGVFGSKVVVPGSWWEVQVP